MMGLSTTAKKKGVVCASAGNHAQGVIYAGEKLGISSDVFIPCSTPQQKIDRVKSFSANFTNVHIVGQSLEETMQISYQYCNKHNKTYVHPFDDIDVIYGQATISVEIHEKLKPDVIVGCVGGGGLLAGLSLHSGLVNPKCDVIGAEPLGSSSMSLAFAHNKPTRLESCDSFVDGAAVQTVGQIPFDICQAHSTEIIKVPEGHLCLHMLDMYKIDGIITEPAGALAVSALDYIQDNIRNKTVVAVISGGNNDIMRYPEIQERSAKFLGHQHYFLLKLFQSPGSLRVFLTTILSENDDITRFEYLKKTNKAQGMVLVGIFSENIVQLLEKLNMYQYNYTYINNKDEFMEFLV
tara:strand:- start:392 stop:1444 length:1053 start_codon:yes stop_codon:yes gene_type:complete